MTVVVLLLFGVLAGFITSISPCVLPVLPIVLTAGSSVRDGAGDTTTAAKTRRPVSLIAGLVLSFAATTLLGSVVLSALGLPQDLLRDIGIAVLLIIGAGLLIPKVGTVIERPFTRLTSNRVPRGNGFGLGLGLGLLYVPCAGPILATVAVAGATHHIGWRVVLLTIAFAVGAGVPLLILAVAGDSLTRRVSALRRRAGAIRVASGGVMVVIAVLIAFNLTDGLQTDVPGGLDSAQNAIGSKVSGQLRALTGSKRNATDAPAAKADTDLGGKCTNDGATLENCGGQAPEFTGISSWLNTPDDSALSLKALRGKVVLVDFWTYSCINCRRAIPHVEAWYQHYAKDGLVVVGVHTPEFAFEHVRSNVISGAKGLGVTYPIAIDNDYDTWNAWGNDSWPAEYLIDAQGNVRHVSIGEGGYGDTEKLIRQLLTRAGSSRSLGATTDVPSATISTDQTPEMHLGSMYTESQEPDLQMTPGQSIASGTSTYRLPGDIEPSTVGLGGRWTQTSQYLQADSDAVLALRYRGRHAYLVLGGSGTVTVSFDGKPYRTLHVSGAPTLYALADTPAQFGEHLLQMSVGDGVQAYAFTFG